MVRIRIQGANSDLHAADARYHSNCQKSFSNPKQIKAVSRKPSLVNREDESIKFVVQSLKKEVDKVWTSVDLHQLYMSNGGKDSNRNRLLTKIQDIMMEEVLSSSGVATIVILRSKAASMFKIEVEDNDSKRFIITTFNKT
jgi:hypothetical protein